MISSHTTPYGSSPEDYGERVYTQPDPDAPTCELCGGVPHPESELGLCARDHAQTLVEEWRGNWPGIEEQEQFQLWQKRARE